MLSGSADGVSVAIATKDGQSQTVALKRSRT